MISIIKLNYNDSLLITTEWTIKNVSSICSYEIPLDPTIIETKSSELYIPLRTLDYGIYELKLTVMINLSSVISSALAFVKIILLGITANLIELGTSIVTRSNQQDVKLDPGYYSSDPDRDTFDANVKFLNFSFFSIVYF